MHKKQPLHPKVARLERAIHRKRWKRWRKRLPYLMSVSVFALVVIVAFCNRPR